MIAILSPAKSLAMTRERELTKTTLPSFLNESEALVEAARKLSPTALSELMDISPSLAQLNYERFQEWTKSPSRNKITASIVAFDGDAYKGLDVESLTNEDLLFAQDHLRILSGLYGILKPLDQIQAYRLEMGCGLKISADAKDLYSFWGNRLASALQSELADGVLINIASNEYFKVLKHKELTSRVITPQFLDAKGGEYKMIQYYAKRARGLMARYIISNRIDRPQDIMNFDLEGYGFNQKLSKGDNWVFTRN
jgi:cytoplasmic iron level regulating protein YaaA (DUF328/UPF0246 family)